MISLKSFIPEIKIIPNTLPKNNQELVIYLNRNKQSFLQQIDQDFVQPRDYFGGTEVLKNVEFKIDEGERVPYILNDNLEGFYVSLFPITEETHLNYDYDNDDYEQTIMNFNGLKLYLHF